MEAAHPAHKLLVPQEEGGQGHVGDAPEHLAHQLEQLGEVGGEGRAGQEGLRGGVVALSGVICLS